MILSDFHCHTTFADGNHSPEEMVLGAIERGIKVLGISEHAFVPFDPDCCLSLETTKHYRSEMERLKEKYQNQIQLLCGIEMDYYSEDDADFYDYVIGSVHYLKVKGETYSVDLSPVETLRCIEEGFGGDPYAYASCYFETVAALKEKWHPHIIGHFDLLTKFFEKGISFEVDNPIYARAAKNALSVLKGSTFEVNTGAISRGYRKEPYPAVPWLKAIKEQGDTIVLSSDSHHRDTLLFEFNKTKEWVHSCGFCTAGFTDRHGDNHIQF